MSDLTIQSLIEAHRATVLADEPMFDGDGRCVDEVGAETTQQAEQQAFATLVGAPCLSREDVAAKVDYFVNGTVAARSSLIDYLAEYGSGSGDLPRGLLQSLVVAP